MSENTNQELTSEVGPKKNKRRKRIIIGSIAAAALVAAGAGTAFAYWTAAGGTGTGTAATGTQTVNLQITQNALTTPLAPGVAAQTISGSIKNNGSTSAYVASVTVSISSVTLAATPPAPGTCTTGDYTLAGTLSIPVAVDIAPGATATFTSTGTTATVAFNDKPTVNQNGCQGATLNLAFVTA